MWVSDQVFLWDKIDNFLNLNNNDNQGNKNENDKVIKYQNLQIYIFIMYVRILSIIIEIKFRIFNNLCEHHHNFSL